MSGHPGWHLAEINIARAIADLTDPVMARFVAQLDAVNQLAEDAPGFVWRLKTDDGAPSSYLSTGDEARLLINMSVWTSVEALSAYTYRSGHVQVFRDRRQWFEPPTAPPFVLWWIPAGTTPTVDDGRRRLALLASAGPTDQGFTFKHVFAPPVVVSASL